MKLIIKFDPFNPPEPETIFSLWLSWKVHHLFLSRPLEFKSIGISAISFFVIEISFFRIFVFLTVLGYFMHNLCQFFTVLEIYKWFNFRIFNGAPYSVVFKMCYLKKCFFTQNNVNVLSLKIYSIFFLQKAETHS